MLRTALLVAVALMVPAFGASPTLERTKPERVVALEGATHHVQGLLIDGTTAYVTSVDRESNKGFLFTYSLSDGRRLRSIEIQLGEMYHPGGFDADDEHLYIPVAEYRPNSRTVVQKRDKETLELVSSFEVGDHIGAVAVGSDRLYMANWDARKIYEYTFDGKMLRARRNPTPWRYQDMKYRYGSLVASALAPRPATNHSVVWIDPETLEPLRAVAAGATDRGVPFVNEGLDLRDGTIYALPEDAPSRIFVFDAMFLADLNRRGATAGD